MGTMIESSWENAQLAEETDRLRAECSEWRLAHARAESLVDELLGMIDEHDHLATGHHPRKWSAWLCKARAMLTTPNFKEINMTINEAIEHAEAQAYKCHGTECGNEHADLARWLRELRARRETGDTCGRQCEGTAYRIELRRLQREMPDLSPVIAWLENDCDPKEAAKELRIYQKRMRSNVELTRRA